jgi:hypothetical protein
MRSAKIILHPIPFFLGCDNMNAIEAIESAKKVNSEVSEDVFLNAIKRLEKQIAQIAKIKNFEFDSSKPLLAAGGEISDIYDDVYVLYLKREGALQIEDGQCIARYDSLFTLRWRDLVSEIVRKHKPEEQSFKDWRWF